MKKIGVFLSTFVILIFAVEAVFSQCGGTYFKTNYRAVNKIFYNGGIFELIDWNGDGKSDFWNLVPNPKTSKKDILIYPAKPDGYWDWDNPIVYKTNLPASVTTYNTFLKIKDYDGDGKLDFFAVDRIHRNNGNGTFTELNPISIPPGNYLSVNDGGGVFDVNGDNRLDWITIMQTGQAGIYSIGYHLENADGSSGSRVNIFTTNELNGSTNATGDFNGDGKIDFAYSRSVGNTYRILLNTGGGNFSVGNLTTGAHSNRFRFVRDFNNDGRADILADNAAGKLIILYGQADGTFNEIEASNYGGWEYTPAEINGDNNLDIIEVKDTFYAVYINNGAGGFTRTIYQKSLGVNASASQILFEDFSGDGKADVYSLAHAVYNIFGEEVIIVKEQVCRSFGETKAANFDNNPMPDLITWNSNAGDWRTTNATSFSNLIIKTFHWGAGSFGDVPAPGDFDGDGKTDYAVYRDSTGTWYINQSADNSWLVFNFGLPGDISVPSDYDGDSKTDIAVFRPSDGNWHLWFSETQQHHVIHFGASGDKPVAADYDGDGKTDVAVFRPSEGNWYYFRSSDQNYNVIHWGIDTDKPVPADYDGDGRADLAVFRSGDWYILRSMNNSYNVFRWGVSGDVPMAMYFNGNVNTETATPYVYRPSNNIWYNYADPSQGITFGGNSFVPIYFGLPNN
ncbi:MAG: VCBS repeat-containing protein [Pyrinomonadaceae bacterium]